MDSLFTRPFEPGRLVAGRLGSCFVPDRFNWRDLPCPAIIGHVKKLSGPILRQLKSQAQRLEPTLALGRKGLTKELLAELNAELDRRELVKLKFTAFKDERKEMARQMAGLSDSSIVSQVGHVVVLFRRHPDPAKRRSFCRTRRNRGQPQHPS